MYNKFLTSTAQVANVFSAEECLRIARLPLPIAESRIETGDVEGGVLDYRFRRTRERPIPPDAEHEWIFRRIGNLVSRINKASYQFQLSDLVMNNVLEYSPDGFFDWHIDLGMGIYATRKISMITFLTPPADYEGGELCFMDQGEPLKLPQGTTVLFPSYLIHRVAPVTKGNRFTLVSWVHGPSFT